MSTVTLTYSEFRALLAPVIPHADRFGYGAPALRTVLVAASGEHLVAQATDKLTAAFCRVRPAVPPAAEFVMALDVDDAEALLDLLEPHPAYRTDHEVTIHVDPHEIAVSSLSSGLRAGFVSVFAKYEPASYASRSSPR